MPLDFPASADALWSLYDTCGVRPEYVIPVMFIESAGTFRPGIQNLQKGDNWGLIQANGPWLKSRGIDTTDMQSWLASREIAEVVTPWVCAAVRRYGKLRSGTRVYQCIYMPESCRYAPGLYDRIASKPAPAYVHNAMFDADGKGWITPGDLGQSITTRALPAAAVQAAIKATYERRPAELQNQQHPAWGTDFTSGYQPSEARSMKLGDWASLATIAAGCATVVVMIGSGRR